MQKIDFNGKSYCLKKCLIFGGGKQYEVFILDESSWIDKPDEIRQYLADFPRSWTDEKMQDIAGRWFAGEFEELGHSAMLDRIAFDKKDKLSYYQYFRYIKSIPCTPQATT